jgi:hypothetical protein
MSTYEALRAMKGRGVATMPTHLAVGQVIRVDGMKYRVQAPPVVAPVTGSILIEAYSEDNQHDTLSLSARRPVRVIGEVA